MVRVISGRFCSFKAVSRRRVLVAKTIAVAEDFAREPGQITKRYREGSSGFKKQDL